MDFIIRRESDSDTQAISDVTQAAFATCPYSRQTEQFIVTALRRAGALTVSLVALVGQRVVGHIALSPVRVTDGSDGWYGLGPISVLPELQRQGIGKALMREGLSELRAAGAKGCVLVGDPRYYERFGFRSLPEVHVEHVPQENVLVLAFGQEQLRGTVSFHEAFAATS